MSHAEEWADEINDTYEDQEPDNLLLPWDLEDGESTEDAVKRILGKAADCLRNGTPTTFTGKELDLVRHLMPAHMVHQSYASRWMQENYDVTIPFGGGK